MKFESLSGQIPQGFIENTQSKIEKYGLDLPITPSELEALCTGDEHCEKALEDMLTYAVRYAADVWSMKELVMNKGSLPEDEWAEKLAKVDRERTQLHNAMIDSVAILSRALLRAEQDNTWVRELAPTGQLERARCGKFAIMLSYWIAVNRG